VRPDGASLNNEPMTSSRPGLTWLRWFVAASITAGCGGTRREPAELGPPDVVTSRAALVASLDTWRADQRGTGVVIGSSPMIGIVDSLRGERSLLDYEVLGPLMVLEKAQPFAVRLVVNSPRETITTRYLVLGRDPLWVFRQEDFERMLHWEHKMDGETNVEKTGASLPVETRSPK
jgi:hypothetical protein